MKENLKFKLDLLQAQLAKINGQEDKTSGKLFQTKFAVLKKSEDADPEQISAEIEQIKQELANRRMHHAQVSLQRQLKAAKQVEDLKITKRLKAAQNQEQKVAALQEEANSLKEFTPADLANEIANRAVLKHYGPVAGFEKQKYSTSQANVYARLCKLPAIQQIVDTLVRGLAEWYNPLEGFGPQATKAKDIQPAAKLPQLEIAPAPAQQDDFHQFESDHEEPEESESESDGFFEQDIEIANTDSEDEGNLPALTQGYISGSEDDEPENPMPERKNRRGQRARRKIWELKYGSRAKHVLKEKEEYEKKKQMKEARQKQRAAKQQQHKEETKNKPLHPSWEAHKKQKEAQKAVQFAGKKITF
ncbi:Protein bud22 [Wickerhamiella sorbophila]|uniref:Protein bud22 n=1 Tax=Wickerhamiella sorbophila TaxID=45607 RepID=A0A2T0FHL5_9ASCO|nr:Protein bud22 [Wickerhamiella sorbophila]PRT54475.1 Protein bud22 [Wickerhamiella sorbophila]